MPNRFRFALLFLLLCALGGCAMQRAQKAEAAQRQMTGMSKEQIFACMGLPIRKGTQGDLEVWLYKSGNDRIEKGGTEKTFRSEDDLSDVFSASILFYDEVKEKRYCLIQVVFKDNLAQSINYSGPTGGFLTQDEQCAYATRNCL